MRGKGRAVGTAALLLLSAAAAFRADGQTVMGRWLARPAFAMELTRPADVQDGSGTEVWGEETSGTGTSDWDGEMAGTGTSDWDGETSGTGTSDWDGETSGTGTSDWDGETSGTGTSDWDGEMAGTGGSITASEPVFHFLVPGERAYNRETGMYVHYIDKGMKQSYASSVPDGMITNDIVSVEMKEGSTWKLFRDGSELVSPDLTVIGEPGSYVLEVTDGSGINTSRLSFRILTGMTNAVDTVRLPEGFTFEDILFNGNGISINSLNEQSLSEDGTYEITFRCAAIDKEYRTKILVDREVPRLALSNVKNGLASGEVSLEDLNPEDRVEITRDGQPYQLSFMKTIKEYGYYTVRVTDPAGNSSLYEFTIQIYLTISSLTAILMAVGVIAGIIWYAVHVRNHLRVR